jgi:dsDNA-specific endonuclease/ATPase MutS2
MFPKMCQKVVKKCSKFFQKVVKKLSKCCQKVVKKLSKSCQKVIKKLSRSYQKNVKVVNFFSKFKTSREDNDEEEEEDWLLLDQVSTSSHLVKIHTNSKGLFYKMDRGLPEYSHDSA